MDAEAKGLRHSEAAGRGRGAPNSPSFRGRRPWNPPGRGIAPKPWTRGDFHYHRHPREDSPPRTRTQRSGSRRNRRSKGANVAFAVRRKRSRADFATTQSPEWFRRGNDDGAKIMLSFSRSARESPEWFRRGNDDGAKIMLSFSRSARESPKWFRRSNDNVQLCTSMGDPRFARMTVEETALARPLADTAMHF